MQLFASCFHKEKGVFVFYLDLSNNSFAQVVITVIIRCIDVLGLKIATRLVVFSER